MSRKRRHSCIRRILQRIHCHMESDAHRVGIAGFVYLMKHCCLTNFKSDWLANVFFFFLSKEEEFLGLK